jgi:hypothetical protein
MALWIPMFQCRTLVRLSKKMNHAGLDWQLIVYGGAMHGFTHEAGPTIPGVAYHAPSDLRSATAIKNFLVELFGADPANQ